MSKPSAPSRPGFTLLEVMISTAIMVVIVLTVVTIASDTMRVYDRAVADLSTQSEARGVLDAMENDFSTAVIRADGRCWMEIVIPGGPGTPSGTPAAVGNVHPIDQPIVMLFSSPVDRPRWTSEQTGRRQLRGDVCAVAYRLGQRSPFDMPGELVQQVYGVYRTVIDPESTFEQGLKTILDGTNVAPTSPWNYWQGGARFFHEYAPLAGASGRTSRALIDATPAGGWTLDEQNFIASNVVAMNLIFWCSSSLPANPVAPSNLRDPLRRLDSTLRPVFAMATDTGRNPGYAQAFESNTTGPTTATAPIRYASPAPTSVSMPTITTVHPQDLFFGRLRVYSNRLYPDGLPVGGPVSAPPYPYLPYTIRGVEISLTLLTPDGSKELRGLQMVGGNAKVPDATFRRIVFQHGRNYTRYVRVLANGG
jgi:prepilin-type N-terminal cleavage/methylation domain-containing protein